MADARPLEAFAKDWIEAWNAHDLDRILAHYTDDVTFVSPFAMALLGEASGTVHGRAALRDYFAKGLERYPDLRFELKQVLAGVGCATLYYRSVRDLMAAETFEFDEHGRVRRALAAYAPIV